MTNEYRNDWLALPDTTLLKQCEVDTYRASGPGGQKRNKTSSAVRLRHSHTGLLVIAEESRSQHDNKAKALKRLRQAIALEIRQPIEKTAIAEGQYPQHELIGEVTDKSGRLFVGQKDRRFWPVAAVILDIMFAQEARVAESARALGISTGNLIRFLQVSPKLWERANQLRHDFGKTPLKR